MVLVILLSRVQILNFLLILLLLKNHSISCWVIIAWRKKSHALARGKALILVVGDRLTILLLRQFELEWRDRRWIKTLLIVAYIARGEGTSTDAAHLIQALQVVILRIKMLSSLLFVNP